MKAQMKSADRLHANYVIVIGEDEVNENTVQLKNMADGQQKKVSMDDLLEELKK